MSKDTSKDVAQPKIPAGPLTDYEICSLFIVSVQTFVEVGSKYSIESEKVFELGKKLFDDSLASIKAARKKLAE